MLRRRWRTGMRSASELLTGWCPPRRGRVKRRVKREHFSPRGALIVTGGAARFLTVGLVLVTMLSAVVLYATTYRTRQIELELQAAEQKLEALVREVATLKAERAYLARPERISDAARALGMRPARGDQFVPATVPSAVAPSRDGAPSARE
ncbi:MAG: cell division protein FtsL [Pseudomonadota bacterium]